MHRRAAQPTNCSINSVDGAGTHEQHPGHHAVRAGAACCRRHHRCRSCFPVCDGGRVGRNELHGATARSGRHMERGRDEAPLRVVAVRRCRGRARYGALIMSGTTLHTYEYIPRSVCECAAIQLKVRAPMLATLRALFVSLDISNDQGPRGDAVLQGRQSCAPERQMPHCIAPSKRDFLHRMYGEAHLRAQ